MFLKTMRQALETGLIDRGMDPKRISFILTYLETPALAELTGWLRDNETEPPSEIMLEAINLWNKYDDTLDEAGLMDCA